MDPDPHAAGQDNELFLGCKVSHSQALSIFYAKVGRIGLTMLEFDAILETETLRNR